MEDLDNAIQIIEQAFNVALVHNLGDLSIKETLLSHQSGFFLLRFRYTNEASDLDKAIHLMRQALKYLSAQHPDRSNLLNALAEKVQLQSQTMLGSSSLTTSAEGAVTIYQQSWKSVTSRFGIDFSLL